MQIFLYEFVTGGGFLGQPEPMPPSLLCEGTAMVAALAADLAAIEGLRVVVLGDHRLGPLVLPGADVHHVGTARQHWAAFEQLAASSDATVLVAPESSCYLIECCRRAAACGGRLLSPGLELVRLASDKQLTVEHLAAAGVPVPEGRPIAPGERLPRDFAYPAVVKPRYGAGSQQVRLLAQPPADGQNMDHPDWPGRLERFCPGEPASVALLCGPAGCVALPPCRQHLSGDGHFAYLGGSLPLAAPLAVRATSLAQRAVATLAEPVGYLGVDLVLGPDPAGADDVVIEINPRLTTSYVGLRAAAGEGSNLADAMLKVAGGVFPELCFRPVRIQFDADGTVQETAP